MGSKANRKVYHRRGNPIDIENSGGKTHLAIHSTIELITHRDRNVLAARAMDDTAHNRLVAMFSATAAATGGSFVPASSNTLRGKRV